MQHVRTLSYLAAIAAATTIVISHASYATQILEDFSSTNTSTTRILPVRPVMKKTPVSTEKNDSTSSTLPVRTLLKTSGINDSFRLESLSVLRLLTKSDEASTSPNSGAVEEAIRNFLTAQAALRKELNALPTGNVMGRSVRNGKVNALIDTYREALRPFISTGKQEQFSGFIMRKRVEVQSQYEKIRATSNTGASIKVRTNTTTR